MSLFHRCFVSDLSKTTIKANSSRETVRVLGVLTRREDVVDTQVFPGFAQLENAVVLTIDDGTAVAEVWATQAMAEGFQDGESVEFFCQLRQNSNLKRWHVSVLIPIKDPKFEALRWMELAYKEQPNRSRQFGYPSVISNEQEALRLIKIECKTDDEGVQLEDLAAVLRQKESVVLEMVQKLQMAGQVYQNQHGKFLPL